jgi:hypothetical protein
VGKRPRRWLSAGCEVDGTSLLPETEVDSLLVGEALLLSLDVDADADADADDPEGAPDPCRGARYAMCARLAR